MLVWLIWALCWLVVAPEPDNTGKALLVHKGKIPSDVDLEF
jgi:hypothetical protein